MAEAGAISSRAGRRPGAASRTPLGTETEPRIATSGTPVTGGPKEANGPRPPLGIGAAVAEAFRSAASDWSGSENVPASGSAAGRASATGAAVMAGSATFSATSSGDLSDSGCEAEPRSVLATLASKVGRETGRSSGTKAAVSRTGTGVVRASERKTGASSERKPSGGRLSGAIASIEGGADGAGRSYVGIASGMCDRRRCGSPRSPAPNENPGNVSAATTATVPGSALAQSMREMVIELVPLNEAACTARAVRQRGSSHSIPIAPSSCTTSAPKASDHLAVSVIRESENDGKARVSQVETAAISYPPA